MNHKEQELIQSTYDAQRSQDDHDMLLALLAITRLKQPTPHIAHRLIELGAQCTGRAQELAVRVLCDDICPKLQEPPTDLLRTHLRAPEDKVRLVALQALLASVKQFGPSLPMHRLANGQSAHPDAKLRSLVLDILHLTSAHYPHDNPSFSQWLDAEPDPECQRKLLIALANAAAQQRADLDLTKSTITRFLSSPAREVAQTARWALELLRFGA